MKRLLTSCFVSLILLSVCYAWPSFGMLQLELTQSTLASIPIAVMPFSGDGVAIAGQTTMAQVIKSDLQNSGEFSVLGPQGLVGLPDRADQVSYAYWRRRKIDDVVLGRIQRLADGQYQVTFQLVNIYDHANNHPGKTHLLINQTFTAPAGALRRLAHHISDLIYQKLTGVRGIFSTRIAYVLVQRSPERATRYSLEVADADGFNPRALLISSQPIMSPAWSPDGQQLAYVSFEGHHAAVYMQNLVTGQRRRISDLPGINGAPAFTPNGQQLALVLTKTGNPKIYLLTIATGQLQQLTRGWSIDTEPAFSPDGKQMLFTSNREGNPQLFDYDLKSHQVKRVTYQGNYNARGAFLPNGQGIVMMHRQSGMFGIARQDLVSGRVEELVETGEDESPSVAPNGRMIIYATEYGNRGVLAQVSIDGRIKLLLPAREGTVQDPAWSPFLPD